MLSCSGVDLSYSPCVSIFVFGSLFEKESGPWSANRWGWMDRTFGRVILGNWKFDVFLPFLAFWISDKG